MRYLGALQQSWFLSCAVGAAVAPIVPTYASGSVILVGLTLLVHEKDQRYPQESWAVAYRAFVDRHRWSHAFVWTASGVGVYGMAEALSHETRGVYLACLAVYALVNLGVPIRAGDSDVAVGS